MRAGLLILMSAAATAVAEEAVRLSVDFNWDKSLEVTQSVDFRSEGLDKDGNSLGPGSGRTEFSLYELWTQTCEQKAQPGGKPVIRRHYEKSQLTIGSDPPSATRTEDSEILSEMDWSGRSTTPVLLKGNASDSTIAILGRAGWEPARSLLPVAPMKPGTTARNLDVGPFLRVSLASLCGTLGPTPEKIAETYAKTLPQGALPCWQAVGDGELKLDGNIATLVFTGKDVVDDHTPPTAIRGRGKGTFALKGRFVLNFVSHAPISIELEVDQTIEYTPILAGAPKTTKAVKLKESLKVVRRYGESK
ncbi:MAG: hypothetical protein FD180_4846 [Planctomycetota bacterium]|nr:MAG: hypothetical protein FD180_4846 [Planctomycetota bacterium]